MMDLPENYAPKYKNRVYYANCCNLCFSSKNLLKCASCLAVSYCSKLHQMEDWSFHKPTCIALKKIKSIIPFPKTRDPMEFLRYRRTQMDCLAMHRGLSDSIKLTEYEKQICLLPWICSVCYRKPSPNFECHLCQSVTYCSAEHKQKDKDNHANFCRKLRNCRDIASWRCENSFKPPITPYIYKKIRPVYRQLPKNKFELFSLIQNEKCKSENFIRTSLLMEPYIPAATILNALEKSGFMKKRWFISKSSKPQWNIDKKHRKVDRKYGLSNIKSNLIIHFAIADDYELSFQWVEIAQLLSDWLINVDKVEIVLTGRMLKPCIVPPYQYRDKLAGVTVHKMAYEEVNSLTIPDIIVMFECQRTLNTTKDLFWDDEQIDGLFRHSEVPVIVASGDYISFSEVCNNVLSYMNVEMVVPTTCNSFTEISEYREWKDHMSTYSKNYFFTVFCRHQY